MTPIDWEKVAAVFRAALDWFVEALEPVFEAASTMWRALADWWDEWGGVIQMRLRLDRVNRWLP